MIATRTMPGAISLSTSSNFPATESSKRVKPVALPPGRAKLATKPWPTGSETCTNMIGTVRVSRNREMTEDLSRPRLRLVGDRPALLQNFVSDRPCQLPNDNRSECCGPLSIPVGGDSAGTPQQETALRIALSIARQQADPSHALGLLCASGERVMATAPPRSVMKSRLCICPGLPCARLKAYHFATGARVAKWHTIGFRRDEAHVRFVPIADIQKVMRHDKRSAN